MQYLVTKFIMKGKIFEGRKSSYMVSLFGIALDIADVGWYLHGSIWFRPEAAMDCAVQRGLNIKDTCHSLGIKGPNRYSH